MQKLKLGVLFGGASSEHDVSLMSAASVVKNLSREKYDIFAVGITKEGEWFYFPELSADEIGKDVWERGEKEPCTISVSRKKSGLVLLDSAEILPLDAVFPLTNVSPYKLILTFLEMLRILDLPFASKTVLESSEP